MEAQYVQLTSYNIPASRMLMDGGHWAVWDTIWNQIRLPGAVREDVRGLKRSPFGGPRSAVEISQREVPHHIRPRHRQPQQEV